MKRKKTLESTIQKKEHQLKIKQELLSEEDLIVTDKQILT